MCQHQFVARIPARAILLDLIARIKNTVGDLDNLNYWKMNKIVGTESKIATSVFLSLC